jgi:hypothetical protein
MACDGKVGTPGCVKCNVCRLMWSCNAIQCRADIARDGCCKHAVHSSMATLHVDHVRLFDCLTRLGQRVGTRHFDSILMYAAFRCQSSTTKRTFVGSRSADSILRVAACGRLDTSQLTWLVCLMGMAPQCMQQRLLEDGCAGCKLLASRYAVAQQRQMLVTSMQDQCAFVVGSALFLVLRDTLYAVQWS